MKKIIEVSSDTNIGGAGKCLITYAQNYDREKYKVKFLLPEGSLLKPELEKYGVEVIEVLGISDKSLDLKSISELKRIFKKEKPDLVHAHASMSARIAAKFSGCKVIYTRHSVFEPSPKISKGIGKIINGAINNYFADGIIAVAEAAKENLVKTGVNEKKIEVILNGTDALEPLSFEDKQTQRRRFLTGNDCVISIIARLEDIKGHEYFIEAARLLLERGVKAKFIIAGTGSYEETLKRIVTEKNLQKNVLFTGFIKDVDKLMGITDIQCNASYGTEATSISLLEGMSLGIPAVVSDFGGNPGVIKHGENGFLFPERDAEAMADAIYKVYSDKDLYGKMKKRAKEIFNETFTAQVMTKNIENYYDKIMN